MNWFMARLAEPSTHAGIAAIVAGVGQIFPEAAPFTSIFAMLFGGIAASKIG